VNQVRVAEVIADTGYLLCFGSVPRGYSLLQELFGGALGAPPAVHWELDNQSVRHSRAEVKAAAQNLSGRNRALILRVALEPPDEEEKDVVRLEIAAIAAKRRDLPVSGADVVLADPANLGEAEVIAVAGRVKQVALINERDGTTCAEQRGIVVEPTAESLRRLLGNRHSANELFRIARDMDRRVGNLGATVTGAAYFRRPTRTSGSGS
jgi:hypothetical protein